MLEESKRVCSRCLTLLPLSEFSKKGKGIESVCKACRRLEQQLIRIKNKREKTYKRSF